jgi:hypothetical protein
MEIGITFRRRRGSVVIDAVRRALLLVAAGEVAIHHDPVIGRNAG